MEETLNVTLCEDDEEISQTSTEGDAINFNEVNSFPDDEFSKLRTSDILCIANTKYFPYVPSFDRLSIINHVSPEPIITFSPLISSTSEDSSIPNIDDVVPALDKAVHPEPAATFESTDLQEDDKDEPINDQPLLQVNSLLADSVSGLPVPQDRWLKWVFRNKMDKERAITKNKARLVAKGYRQGEDGVHSVSDGCKKCISKWESIRGSVCGTASGFESSEFLNYVYKLNKALYGLKQAPRAWYLKSTPNLGIWYPKGLGFDLKAYSDSNYAGCNLDRKTEAEYVAAAGCCAQVLWIKSQMADYDVLYDKEFWYTTEVEEETNTITFSLSWWDEPLFFTQKEFISAIGLPVCKNPVPPPPKETEVNADDTADKSLSRASQQPVTRPKAPTNLKTKKKKIPYSS
nr:hypothetical protein [Tanacetum cinerariifolium]